jgi:hypothetical protein
MFSRVFLSQKERETLEQVFEAQQRPDSLVEGILVKDQARSPRRGSVASMSGSEHILMPHPHPSKSGHIRSRKCLFWRKFGNFSTIWLTQAIGSPYPDDSDK